MHQALVDSVKASMVLPPGLRDDTAAASKFVDMREYDYVEFLILVGATDTTFDAKVQESDSADGSNEADVEDADITQVGADGDNRMVVVSVHKSALSKRYVGVLATSGDGTAGVNNAVIALRYGKSGRLPETQETAGDNSYATAEVVRVGTGA